MFLDMRNAKNYPFRCLFVTDDYELAADDEVVTFVRAAESADSFITTDYYEPVRMAPSTGGISVNFHRTFSMRFFSIQ